MLNDLPPWLAVHQQSQRGGRRAVLRLETGRWHEPRVAVIDRSTPRSTPECSTLAGFHIAAFMCLMLKKAEDVMQNAKHSSGTQSFININVDRRMFCGRR